MGLRPYVIAIGLGAVAAGAAAAAQPSQASDFVNAAAQSDAFETVSGRLVLTQSSDPKIRAFAQQMVDDHAKTTADLRAAVQASKLPQPIPGLNGDQQKLLNALQSLKGADLDRSFMTQQIDAHAAALATEQDYLSAGADPNLRKVAQGAAPVIGRHLEMARQMRASMGGD